MHGYVLGHKGKIVATGMLAVGAGSVALILPHFLAGTYYADERASDVCTANEGFGEWPQHKDALNRVFVFLSAKFAANSLF